MTFLWLGLASWLVMGLATGVLGRLLLSGPPPLGWLIAVASGVAGALLGGALATVLRFGGLASYDLRSLTTATLGAMLIVLLARLMSFPEAA